MPGVSGVTAVTNACATYHCARGCGCVERPAFPAPSIKSGRNFQAKLARNPRRDRGVTFQRYCEPSGTHPRDLVSRKDHVATIMLVLSRNEVDAGAARSLPPCGGELERGVNTGAAVAAR